MDQAWLEIIDRLCVEDVIRMRRTCSRIDDLVTKSLKSKKYLDVELECPSVIRDSTALASVIAQCSYNLQNLDLKIRPANAKYAIMSSDVEIRRRVMQSINDNAIKLKTFHIDRCRISAGAIGSFGDLPESLEEISITNSMIECSEWDVATIIRKSFATLFQKCRKLKYFEISGRSMNNSHFHVDPTILQYISDTIEHLAIAVGNSLRIDNLAFLRGKNLKTLILQRSFISPCDLDHILAMADTITHLDLSYSPNLLDCQQISKLKNLKHLSLINNRDGFRDDALILIIQECTELEELSLDNCESLTMKSLLFLGSLQHLRKLTLSGIPNVNDAVCQQISNCKKLTFLDINYCLKVQTHGLQCLLSCLMSLSHLEVLGIRAYSHQLLTQLSSYPKSIISDSAHFFSFSVPSPITPSSLVKG